MSRSELSADELASYLQATDPAGAEMFARTGGWPENIQIPKDVSVMNEAGRIDWDQVPQNGYRLDNGKPVKQSFVPEIGQVLDRFGPPNGRKCGRS